MNAIKTTLLCCLLLACTVYSIQSIACPFCSAVSQTLSQEIEACDVAVIAKLVNLPPEIDLDSEQPVDFDLDNLDVDSGMAEFEVVEVIRRQDELGVEAPAAGSRIQVVYYGDSEQKEKFLVKGIAGAKVDWGNPIPLTERAVSYVKQIQTLPEKGPDRLAFFLDHLEDEDALLAQDAYDEFGRAPYETVVGVGDRMDRPQLLAWIQDSKVGPTRRRLYLTMLGICGEPEDVAILESLINYNYAQIKPGISAMLTTTQQIGPAVGASILHEMVRADVRRKQQCLDALIAAYLKLMGPAGLPLIEERFLKNPAAEYSHVYATIMALRFHGEETDSLPRERLLQSVRLLLNNKAIVDQVIPDLARWEDWSVLEQLTTLFKESESDSWVRPPIVAYLVTASEQPAEVGEQANAALKELETLDPKTVKRARNLIAFGLPSRSRPTQTTDSQENFADVATSKPSKSKQVAKQSTTLATTSALAAESVAEPIPSRLMLVGGPLIAGLVLFGVFGLLLRSADVRSSSNDS